MALLARIRSRLVAYAFAFLVVGSLAGTAVLALHSASPFNVLGRLLTEQKADADSAGVKLHTPAANAPAPASTARVTQDVSSLVNSGDLPSFNPFTSIEPAMKYVLSTGGEETSVYQAPESLLPPVGSFDGSSDTPEFQIARASGGDLYGGGSGGGSLGGFASANPGFGGGSVSRPEYSETATTPEVRVDDFRPRSDSSSSNNGGSNNGSSSSGSSSSGNSSVPPNGGSSSTGKSSTTPAGDKPATGTTSTGRTGGSAVDALVPSGPTGVTTGGGGGSNGPVSVPEPSSLLLTGAGLVGLANAMRRRSER